MLDFRMPKDEFNEMAKNVMTKSRAYFVGNEHVIINKAVDNVEKLVQDYIFNVEKYDADKRDLPRINVDVEIKRNGTKEVISRLVNAIKFVYGKDSKAQLAKAGLHKVSSKHSQKAFNEMVKNSIRFTKELFLGNETLKVIVEEFEKVGSEYLEIDMRYEKSKDENSLLHENNVVRKENTVAVLKKLADAIEFIFEEKTKEILINLGYKFYIPNKKNKDDDNEETPKQEN